MRMSVRKNDPGYNKRAHQFKVFLDGKPVTKCVMADEEIGCVWRYKTDANGRVILNEEKAEILKEQLFGRVEIRRR